jgi:photosystem II stability/assembly factor-like uncharacterized protein
MRILKRYSLFLILTLALQTPVVFSQLQNNNWIFGYGARVNFSGPIPVGSSNAAINSNESTASVSDPSSGQLLFYTDGRKVWNAKQQRVAKTTDGGETWQEINLVEDASAREFGVGFIDENHGFVGTMNSSYETKDGGKTWSAVDLGRACNKIRIYKDATGKVYGYAIGVDVMKGEF